MRRAQVSVYIRERSIEDRIPGHPQRSCSLILARSILGLGSLRRASVACLRFALMRDQPETEVRMYECTQVRKEGQKGRREEGGSVGAEVYRCEWPRRGGAAKGYITRSSGASFLLPRPTVSSNKITTGDRVHGINGENHVEELIFRYSYRPKKRTRGNKLNLGPRTSSSQFRNKLLSL